MEIKSRSGKIAQGSTVVDMNNLKKKSDVIDSRGNKIDLATKRIIEPKDKDSDTE